jgi:phosphopantothenoylcysteine decarboxylase/phosphopantothenate--cysteine ligase
MKVALGVTGCIAAYKSVEILRGLQKRGVDVQVLMTRNGSRFVSPLTFQSISGHPVIGSMFKPTEDPEIKHIQIAQWIDLLLVAPATANTLARFANGIADDFLSTVYISTTAPVLVAPAMNVEMWAHPATQENVRRLRDRGVEFVDPDEGYLACRTVGAGRLAEPARIVDRACEILNSSYSSEQEQALFGERILVTAGPTFEPIDPVRGLTNRSSGRMGYAVAQAAISMGAEVTLVSGPVSINPPAGAKTIKIRTAAEMFEAVMANLEQATVVVMAAAVADYRPAVTNDQKIKKDEGDLTLVLERTEDILSEVGKLKGNRLLIGFAAETENLIDNARKKLLAKRADLIVANDVSEPGSGFDVETNRVTLVSAEGEVGLPLMSKAEAARRIMSEALRIRKAGVHAAS